MPFKRYLATIMVFLAAMAFPLFLSSSAYAIQAWTSVICQKADGTTNTFQIGWDNSNQFFDGKGYIPRLFCEGGYAQGFELYVSDDLADSSLGYFNGVVPNPVQVPVQSEPTPTETPVPDTATPTPTNPSPSDQPSPSPEPTPTASATPEPSAVPSPSPSPSPSSEPTPEPTQSESQTAVVPDSLTAASETQTSPTETSTNQVETPPAPPPVVEPQPIVPPQPVVEAPKPPEPQPETPEPEPEPEPTPTTDEPLIEEPTVAEPPLEEPPLEEPSVEEPLVNEPLVEEPKDVPVEEPEAVPVAEPESPAEPPVIQQVVTLTSETNLEALAPDTPVQLENGVILTAEVVVALQVLENPAELLGELLTDPGKVLLALASVGSDMTPEDRDKSQKAVVSAVIATSLATQIRRPS